MKSWLPHAGTVLQYKDNFQLVKENGVRMVLLLEISTPCKVQAEWPRMDVIVLTLVLNLGWPVQSSTSKQCVKNFTMYSQPCQSHITWISWMSIHPPLHQWYQHQHSVQDALVCWWQCYLPADLVWGGSRNSSTRPKHPGRLVHKMAHGIQHQEVCYPDHHKEVQPEHVPVYPTEWGYP